MIDDRCVICGEIGGYVLTEPATVKPGRYCRQHRPAEWFAVDRAERPLESPTAPPRPRVTRSDPVRDDRQGGLFD